MLDESTARSLENPTQATVASKDLCVYTRKYPIQGEKLAAA